jgi:hypothetical protein
VTNFCVNPGDTVQFGTMYSEAPSDIGQFLEARDWIRVGEGHWQHSEKHRWHLTWEQAVACEFYEFITLGGR